MARRLKPRRLMIVKMESDSSTPRQAVVAESVFPNDQIYAVYSVYLVQSSGAIPTEQS